MSFGLKGPIKNVTSFLFLAAKNCNQITPAGYLRGLALKLVFDLSIAGWGGCKEGSFK